MTNPGKPYTVGIIGCGGIAAAHHTGFTQTGRATIRSVYDLDPEQAKARGDEWGVEVAESAEALVDSVDIVVIATPGFARLEYVKLAVQAGDHVLCEKPLALNLDEARAIETAVAAGQSTFMVSLNQRYEPELVTLQEVAASGQLGGLVSAWVRWHAPVSSERWRGIEASGHWRSSFELSGGRINEFSGHAVDWLLWVLGKPISVYGRSLQVTEGFKLDDATYAMLNCEQGTGLLDVARHAGVRAERSYGIQGHAGSIALIDGEPWLTLMDTEPVRIPVAQPRGKHDHFLDCIESGESPKTDITAGLETLRACVAFNDSAASGVVEPVDRSSDERTSR